MYEFTMPREAFDERNINKQDIRYFILKHLRLNDRIEKNRRYYAGEHDIKKQKEDKRPLVCNHSKEISDTASSYFLANPIVYKSDEDLTELNILLKNAGADEVDGDNSLDLSITGLAYEYYYIQEDGAELVIKNLEPEHTFIVYDDTIEQNELFAVYYYIKKDDRDTTTREFMATVLTPNFKYTLSIFDDDTEQLLTEIPIEHYFKEIPVTEFKNNKLATGDFELQIPLIDAYNMLMTDRIKDKEQFIDSILAIYGAMLSDEIEEDGESPMQTLKKEKYIELPTNAKAEYLTRTFDEAGVEILKKAIEQDIHKFSHIPCMTDEAFGGNVSGVAMEFKLLGMENITKIKTRYYKKGLRKRMRILCNWIATKSNMLIDYTGIDFVFTRAMPKNLLEISQIVANLDKKVSRRTLLAQIPFVNDVEKEIEELDNETQENIKQQKEMFGMQGNEPLEDEEDDEE